MVMVIIVVIIISGAVKIKSKPVSASNLRTIFSLIYQLIFFI
jgi:hypothetical protein